MANLSTLTTVPSIAERSEATPGLWNNIFSVISQNVDQINASAGGGIISVNPLNYGADLTGVADSSTAFALARAAANGAPIQLSAGTYLLNSSFVFPAGQRTQLLGAGRDVTRLIAGAGVTSLLSAAHSHQAAEFHCRVADLTLDGGNGDVSLINFERMTTLHLERLRLSNSTGTAFWPKSIYDPQFLDIFIDSSASARCPCVIDTVTSPSGEEFAEGKMFDIHVEPTSATSQPFIWFRGNSTNQVRYGNVYGLKAHGDTSSASPGVPLLWVSPNAPDLNLFGVQLAYGNGIAQSEISANNVNIVGLSSVILDAHPPVHAVRIYGNDVHIDHPTSRSASYGTSFVRTESGAARPIVSNPGVNTAVALVSEAAGAIGNTLVVSATTAYGTLSVGTLYAYNQVIFQSVSGLTIQAPSGWTGVGSNSVNHTIFSDQSGFNQLMLKGDGRLRSQTTGTTATAISVQSTACTNEAFQILSNGQMNWGPGNAGTDATLLRTGAATIGVSNTTFQLSGGNLNVNQQRTLSMRTLAASSVTASAANTNVAVNEVVFTIGGASGASLCISSGGTTYIFNSAISAKNT